MAISQDPALAKKGQSLFNSKACGTCHTVGKGRLVGPDLAGVTSRRDAAWLRSWLHDPPAMIASGDAVAVALLAEYKGVKMPNMELTDADIDALLAYTASKSK